LFDIITDYKHNIRITRVAHSNSVFE